MDADRVRELLDYCPETGKFTNRISRSHNCVAGAVVGCASGNGYLRAQLDGKFYCLHRLAWLHFYGEWPANQIDHRNEDKSDNRISNLREANHSENKRNMSRRADNKSGYKGVYFCKNTNKWRAQVKLYGKNHGGGSYLTVEEAAEAAYRLRDLLHGEFANHGGKKKPGEQGDSSPG